LRRHLLTSLESSTTEQRRAKQALIHLADIVQSTDDAIISKSLEGVITSWNKGAERIYGYTAEEVIGQHISVLVPPGYENDVGQILERIKLGEHIDQYETVRMRKGGSPVQVSITVSPIPDASGTITGASVIARDITERKQVERELAEHAAELKRQADILDLAHVMIRDMEERIIFWNSGMEHLYGWAREEASGRVAHDLLQTQFPEPLEEIREKLLRDGQWSGELVHTRRNNQQLVVASTWSLHVDERGNPAAVLEDNNDITKVKQLEEQLRQSQKLEAIGQLAGGVAHDFNNLLTVIAGYSELLLERSAGDEMMRSEVEEITKAAESAASLTRQLLAFSRKQTLRPVVSDPNLLVSDVSKMLRRLIGTGVELVTVLKPEVGLVSVDSTQIEQVLMNLVLNARDAMPKGGKVVVETKNVELDAASDAEHLGVPAGRYVMLAVSDTGCGMNEETRKRIFEPFFTTKEVGKGTGLGLSTVYGIVKQSGGNILVYSQVGVGTTFKIYLPSVAE
jgi:PAS domain S-box-containing protein